MADVDVTRTLYQFLDQQFDSQAPTIVAAFSANPLCLTSGSLARFLPSGQVFWQDPGPAFLCRRGFLSGDWPDLKAFFVRKLGVAVSPSPEDYATMLRELSEENLSPQQERAVWAIYRELDRCLVAAGEPEEVTDKHWWKELLQEAVFWTDKGEFWCNESDLFVNDHNEFHSLFKDHPKAAFLKMPANQHPQVSRFLKAAGIPLLLRGRLGRAHRPRTPARPPAPRGTMPESGPLRPPLLVLPRERDLPGKGGVGGPREAERSVGSSLQ